jgi:hypothetical protein
VTKRTFRTAALVTTLLAVATGSVWAATVNGTARNDTLRGGARADKIYGKGGNDRLYGAGGNDVLVGGPGSDLLVGGAGADTLRCGPGRDRATRDVRDKVASDCEVVRGPQPSPQPPTPPPPTPPIPPALPAGVQLVIEGGISATDRSQITDLVSYSATEIERLFATSFTGARVLVSDDIEWILDRQAEVAGRFQRPRDEWRANWLGGNFGTVYGRSVLIYWAAQWQQSRPSNRLKVMAHEVFHALQSQWAPEMSGAEIYWLVEGTAEVVGHRVAGNRGSLDYQASVAEWKTRTRAVPLQLEAMERDWPSAFYAALYPLSALACDYLVGGSQGVGKFASYFTLLGQGLSWPQAFERSYGKSVGQFYSDFVAYRQTL